MSDHTEEDRSWEDVRAGQAVLKRGEVGPVVAMLQERLAATGYDVDVTGVFGPQTEFSVMDLQKNNQITRTGQVGSRTSEILDTLWHNTWEQVGFGYKTLALGEQSPAVRTLQEYLTEAGYTVESSGVFGPSTRRRVQAFQEAMGIPPTGEVDQVTAAALTESAAERDGESLPDPTGTTGPSESDLVVIQDSLVDARVAEAFNRMARAARGDGVVLKLLEGYRDVTRQKQVARQGGFITTSACTGNPGSNAHGTGLAVDMDDGRSYRWLRRNAIVFGFVMPHTGEPWHWTFKRA